MKLAENVKAIGTLPYEEVKEKSPIHGVPLKYFHKLEKEEKMHHKKDILQKWFMNYGKGDLVYLDTKIASQLDWHVDEELKHKNHKLVNINAGPNEFTIDGETYTINPGFWCSIVRYEDLIQ